MLSPLQKLHGYQLAATDGIIGHVTGVYFDADQWMVRYLVVNFTARQN